MKQRFIDDYQLSEYDAGILSADGNTGKYFEAVVKTSNDAKLSANWVMGELAAKLNAEEKSIAESPVSATDLGQLILRIKDGTITGKAPKEAFGYMWAGEGDADTVINDRGLKPAGDDEVAKIVDEIIANNEKQVANYRAADPSKQPKMLGFFVGQVMKATGGKANPKTLNAMLLEKLKG